MYLLDILLERDKVHKSTYHGNRYNLILGKKLTDNCIQELIFTSLLCASILARRVTASGLYHCWSRLNSATPAAQSFHYSQCTVCFCGFFFPLFPFYFIIIFLSGNQPFLLKKNYGIYANNFLPKYSTSGVASSLYTLFLVYTHSPFSLVSSCSATTC